MCTVRLRRKDKDVKSRFFIVSGDGQELLVMPDTEVLNILKITCEVNGNPNESRHLNSQTTEASNCPSCKTNKATQIKIDNLDVNYANADMPDYFRSSINEATDNRASQVLTNKIYNELSIVFFILFSGIGCFESTFNLQVKYSS